MVASASLSETVILIVEDEAILRLHAVELLNDAGFATLEAGEAEEALDVLDRHPDVSVLFTDINMPGRFDGLELARRVHARRPDIKLILTSGRPAPAAKDIPDEGRFIAKPYDLNHIAQLVRAIRH